MASRINTVRFDNDDIESRLSPTSASPRRISIDRAAPSLRSEHSSTAKSPSVIRRASRSKTTETFRTIDAVEFKPNWHAGQEPGLDPSGTHLQHEECQITVVDYSEEDIRTYEHENASFIEFLEKPQEAWVRVRWINVNGLSWDVVQALAKNKRFHRLAIEDLMSRNNRTKVDWSVYAMLWYFGSCLMLSSCRYREHTYIAMTLQKLVHRETLEEAELDEDNNGGFLRNFFHREAVEDTSDDFIERHTKAAPPKASEVKTIQRYFGGQNHERADYMERHSALAKKDLVVNAEQVSIFLTAGKRK
jgi:hypothetical protein